MPNKQQYVEVKTINKIKGKKILLHNYTKCCRLSLQTTNIAEVHLSRADFKPASKLQNIVRIHPSMV